MLDSLNMVPSLKESQAPSMMNLLDEDDDEDVDDGGFITGEHNTSSEPYGSSSNTQVCPFVLFFLFFLTKILKNLE